MRLILYTLFAVGGVLVALAFNMDFLDNEIEQSEPQGQLIKLGKTTVKKADATANVETNKSDEAQTIVSALDVVKPFAVDIARVQPDGSAIFAGIAPPNSKISIFEGKILLGKTFADLTGEWLVLLEKPLAVGQHLISMAIESVDGSVELASHSFAIEIYEDSDTKPLIAMLPETASEMPVLIQSPDDVTIPKAQIEVATKIVAPQGNSVQKASSDGKFSGVGIQEQPRTENIQVSIAPTAILWRNASKILRSGISRGGTKVIASDLNGPIGEALVLNDGKWQVGGSLNLKTVLHRLQFDLYDGMNKVIARYSLPLKSRDLAKGKDGSPLIVVNRGDALWRIAYRRFGDGIKYVDIVRRNQSDIENPDLIYPKQIFALPKAATDLARQN